MSNIEFDYAQADSLVQQRQYDAARKLYIQISEKKPFDFDAALQELRCSMHVCDWRRYDHLQRLIQGTVRYMNGWACGSTLLASPYFNAADLRLSADRYAAMWLGRRQSDVPATAPRLSEGRRTIRVGFLGRQFDQRPLADFATSVVRRQHDGSAFEYIIYDMAPDSAIRQGTEKLFGAFNRYVPVSGLGCEELATRLRKDGLDVLVFMQGPTDPLVGVLAHKPAPCVLGFPIYPAPLGALVDGLIVDHVIVPPGREADYSEKIWRVPGCYRTKQWKPVTYRRARRVDHGLPVAACVLAYFGPSHKITPDLFDRWCAVLRRFPGCVLWLLARDQTVTLNLSREAAIRGVGRERLIFATQLNEINHRQRWSCADIALDTYPYNSFSNVHDALSSGVAVVTWAGETMASRIGASLLKSANLVSGVATSGDMYESCLEGLISNPTERLRIRAHLIGEQGVLRNGEDDTRTSLEAIWTQVCQKRAAENGNRERRS
ncbi:hypothetical protein H0X90_34955 [Burkholderia sp. 9775_39]|uniref:O-linked N-acetylglucosamine transferase family protein n=1 Tax=unclassified Burkholderia TaxID=2613784 RepID=UPI0018C35895|nr:MULTISPECIES: hypothetical protein [unclassified Burkholderia]MBG0882000.1 hypothetical protein [Burkholderia sp. 9775_39]MBG0888912.1 hypothetical protein [Burkholderia sp. 9773_38]